MRRSPRPSANRTLLPTFIALASACNHTTQPPGNPPPPRTPTAVDAAPSGPVVTPVDPAHLPNAPAGGLRMVTALPPARAVMPTPPTPAPAARAPRAAADPEPSAAAIPAPFAMGSADASVEPLPPELAGRAPGLYIVHSHAPGVACHPIQPSEIQAALGQTPAT